MSRLWLLILAFTLLAGCATYDGTGFRQLATAEKVNLDGSLSVERCDALRAGATALLDETGDSKAFKGPFGVGFALDDAAAAHDRQGVICDEAVSRDLQSVIMKENFKRFWGAHDATFGE